MKRQLFTALAFVTVCSLAHGVEARPVRTGDISVSITLREDVAALGWINATNPTAASATELHDLIALLDDAGIEEARVYIGKQPPTKLKTLTFDQVPETPTMRNMSKTEAELLVRILAPTEKFRQDLATGRVLSALADKVTAAIGKK